MKHLYLQLNSDVEKPVRDKVFTPHIIKYYGLETSDRYRPIHLATREIIRERVLDKILRVYERKQ